MAHNGGMSPGSDAIWWVAQGRGLRLDRPRVMAILNVTPDSFSDGGMLPTPHAAADAAERAVGEGADVLDMGAESTRPGAERVPAAEQIRRLVPAVRAVRSRGGALASVPISVDTTLAEVASAALDAGADAVNDVSAGTEDAAMLTLAARRGAGLVLMHRVAPPGTDRYSDQYAAAPISGDVMDAVRGFLLGRARAAEGAGVPRGAIVLDPGLGFGKTVEQNLELIRRTGELAGLGYPVLSGVSRKSFVGRAMLRPEDRATGTPPPPAERVPGSVGLSVAHLVAGARIFRVHDVRAHAAALRAAWAARG